LSHKFCPIQCINTTKQENPPRSFLIRNPGRQHQKTHIEAMK